MHPNSYNDFAEWLDIAYWWSCFGIAGVALEGVGACSLRSRLLSINISF